MRTVACVALLAATSVAHAQPADGARLYQRICQGCHMADARGAEGAGRYPALAGNPRLAARTYPVHVVLNGRHGMPPFAAWLDDAQVAAVVNHVRSNFGNTFTDVVTPEEVRGMRPPAPTPHR